jgi:hypothetical protein
VENGSPISRQSKRSLARALGFDDYDAFDSPERAAAFREMMELFAKHQSEEQLRDVMQKYPDHLVVEATRAEDGGELTRFADGLSGLGLKVDDELGDADQTECYALAQYVQDYGDISESLHGFEEIREYQRDLTAKVEALKARGISVHIGIRRTKITNDSWSDKTPIPWTVGYLVFSRDRAQKIRVLAEKRIQL